MESIEALSVAMVPGVNPGKWLDRWAERRPDVPLEVAVLGEAEQLAALAGRHLLFARSGGWRPEVRGASGLLTIPLYEERPVAVVPAEHLLALAEEVPVRAVGASELLDVEALGYEQAIALAGNGAGVAVVPQAVARALSRKDTAVAFLNDDDPAAAGLETPEGDALSDAEAERILEPTRVWLCFERAWQDAETGENHPVIEEFIGIVRGRREGSSRQPSVREREQAEAKRRTRERQSGQAGRAGGSGQRQRAGSVQKGTQNGGQKGTQKGASQRGSHSRSSGRPGSRSRGRRR